MGSSNLSTLQREFLEEFFRREDRFFLSGGAALVGFYLGHPGGASTDELRQYLANLIERLTQLSFPVEG
ncbi:MAG: hypothetical protein KIT57_14505 [Blastocatellales bacterium]|nr:hypothetical protein [Blastocatellales bacterium]